MKYLKITLFSLVGIIALVVGSGLIIAYFYEDEVKDYFKHELNKYLNTEVIIDNKNIDLTVLKNFPYTSIEFKNVIALDAISGIKKDTLFKAGNISLQFSLLDIYRKNYRIKKIAVSDAAINIRIDEKGNDNYHFWKASNDTTSTSFSFGLKKFVFNNVSIAYINHQKKQDYTFVIKKARLTGEFSDENYQLETNADLFIHHLQSNTTYYLREKSVKLDLDLSIDKRINSYTINKGLVQLADLNLAVSGNVIYKNELSSLFDLTAKGKDMDIQTVLSLLPANYHEYIKEYESSGDFYFKASIKGELGETTAPSISAKYGIDKGEITHNSSSVTLKNVNLKGIFSSTDFLRPENYHLTIEQFSAQLEKGNLNGKFQLENFIHPFINTSVNAELELEDLQKLMPIDTIESVHGKLKLNASFIGRVNSSGKNKTENFKNGKTTGEMNVMEASVRLKNNPLQFDNLNASFTFNNNDVAVKSFKGNVSNSDFELNGFFRNALAYLFFDKEELTVEATLKSKNIDLNELLADKKNTTKKDTVYNLHFSQLLNLNIENQIEHIAFRKFEASNIHGKLKLQDKKIIVDPLSFSTMDGEVVVSGMIDDTQNDKILITCDASVKNLNINKLFYQLENFGQEVIQDKNLKGNATATIQLASVWSPDLTVDMDKIYVRSNLTIDKGELNHFEPMKALSKFIMLSELENIKFSTLQNEIEIKNQKFYIPKMEIKSNALNLTASGTHTFNNEIDYKIKMLLNDLLAKKAKTAKKENDEFGTVEDDGLGKINLFLSMTGTIDKPIIKYDRKSAVEKVKQDFKVEKQNLKTILKEEFGWFKKDTTVISNKKIITKKEEDDKFIIKWNEGSKEEKKEEDDF